MCPYIMQKSARINISLKGYCKHEHKHCRESTEADSSVYEQSHGPGAAFSIARGGEQTYLAFHLQGAQVWQDVCYPPGLHAPGGYNYPLYRSQLVEKSAWWRARYVAHAGENLSGQRDCLATTRGMIAYVE